MTPEERMRDALDAATIDHPSIGTATLSLEGLVEHGAAAIRRALADQRATMAAYLHTLMAEVENSERSLGVRLAANMIEVARDAEWAASTRSGG